ncbi:MAG: SgcJ/EcaC family oxidoreductase [Gemmatimonadaceae bacterium]
MLGIALAMTTGTTAVAQPSDEAEVRAVATQQGDTWTRHDAKAYAALFTEDCDVVNVLGWWWKGRADLDSKLTTGFSYVFKESRLTITDVKVRFVTPGIAIAHAMWTMTGARSPTGIQTPPSAGIQTLVLTKQDGHWLISAFQNTNGVPERPFPTGPVSPER